MLTIQNAAPTSGLTTQGSKPAIAAVDVLFHPTSRSSAGNCPLHPPSEAEMDAAGIACALVSQCRKWSCERQWMCEETRLDDVLCYTRSSSRFIGLAGYNPFDIADSLREIEFAVATHGFRGVYLHVPSFNLSLRDRRVYPMFAKAAELGVPAMMQLPPVPSLAQEIEGVAADFAELALVVAQSRPELKDLTAIAERCENVCFALDPAALLHVIHQWTELAVSASESKSVPDFMSEIFAERCMWGSNGRDWPAAVRVADPFPLLSDARANFYHRNAERVFSLTQPLVSRAPHSVSTEILIAER